MSVGTAMIRQARIHESKSVEELRPRAEGAANAWRRGALMQSERGGGVKDVVDACFRRLRHASTSVGGKRFEIASRAFCVEDSKRQRGFSGAGDADNSDDFIKRDIDVDVFEIMDLRAAHEYFFNHRFFSILFNERLRNLLVEVQGGKKNDSSAGLRRAFGSRYY